MNQRIMYYTKTISPLKEKASAQVAIGLCQDNAFKEIVLCLEKPTYGCFCPVGFVSDPKVVSKWYKAEKDFYAHFQNCMNDFYRFSYSERSREYVILWEAGVDYQCHRMTEKLPPSLRQWVHAWIYRIALEYLCYSRRIESLFGVSRYFLMTFLTREYWKEDCRLDEENIAPNLLKDERLTDLQKYGIACVYYLHEHIPELWVKLTESEKESINDNLEFFRVRIRCGDWTPFDYTVHVSVLLWSYQMDGDRDVKLTEEELWARLSQEATYCGNRAAVKLCWERLSEETRQLKVIDMALESLQRWESVVRDSKSYDNYKLSLLTNDILFGQYFTVGLKNFVLPSYHSELVRYFLTQMDEEQQLIFFHKAFEERGCNSVLKCFLYWPFQDDLLPTINRLWEIVPEEKYKECIFFLGSLCIPFHHRLDEVKNRYYDYHSLLSELWETTPEEYKQCIFNDENHKILLHDLIVNSQEGDEAFIKRIFSYQPQEARGAMMHSDLGKGICTKLLEKGKWSFLNWLLEKCLAKEEIPGFKLQFIQSKYGKTLCCTALSDKCGCLAEDLIDWSMDSNTDKTHFKLALINHPSFFSQCDSLLRKGEFIKVESILNFCTSSDEMKVKSKIAEYTCNSLLSEHTTEDSFEFVRNQLDTILAWGMDTREKIRYSKEIFLSERVIDIHYDLVFIRREWEEVQRLYEWLDLSTEEIKKLKITAVEKDMSFYLSEDERGDENTLVEPLRWCLTDDEMVKDFKNVAEKYHEKFDEDSDYEEGDFAWFLDKIEEYIEIELFCHLRKEECPEASAEEVSVKGEREASCSVVIEEESSSSRKKETSVISKNE